MICFSSVRNQWVCDDLTENAWPTKGAKLTTRIKPKLTIDHCTSTHKNMGPSPLRKVKHGVGLLKATFQINSPGIWRFVSKERGGRPVYVWYCLDHPLIDKPSPTLPPKTSVRLLIILRGFLFSILLATKILAFVSLTNSNSKNKIKDFTVLDHKYSVKNTAMY